VQVSTSCISQYHHQSLYHATLVGGWVGRLKGGGGGGHGNTNLMCVVILLLVDSNIMTLQLVGILSRSANK